MFFIDFFKEDLQSKHKRKYLIAYTSDLTKFLKLCPNFWKLGMQYNADLITWNSWEHFEKLEISSNKPKKIWNKANTKRNMKKLYQIPQFLKLFLHVQLDTKHQRKFTLRPNKLVYRLFQLAQLNHKPKYNQIYLYLTLSTIHKITL